MSGEETKKVEENSKVYFDWSQHNFAKLSNYIDELNSNLSFVRSENAKYLKGMLSLRKEKDLQRGLRQKAEKHLAGVIAERDRLRDSVKKIVDVTTRDEYGDYPDGLDGCFGVTNFVHAYAKGVLEE